MESRIPKRGNDPRASTKTVSDGGGLSGGAPQGLVDKGKPGNSRSLKPAPFLDALLEGVTDQNRHPEVPTASPMGGEVW